MRSEVGLEKPKREHLKLNPGLNGEWPRAEVFLVGPPLCLPSSAVPSCSFETCLADRAAWSRRGPCRVAEDARPDHKSRTVGRTLRPHPGPVRVENRCSRSSPARREEAQAADREPRGWRRNGRSVQHHIPGKDPLSLCKNHCHPQGTGESSNFSNQFLNLCRVANLIPLAGLTPAAAALHGARASLEPRPGLPRTEDVCHKPGSPESDNHSRLCHCGKAAASGCQLWPKPTEQQPEGAEPLGRQRAFPRSAHPALAWSELPRGRGHGLPSPQFCFDRQLPSHKKLPSFESVFQTESQGKAPPHVTPVFSHGVVLRNVHRD